MDATTSRSKESARRSPNKSQLRAKQRREQREKRGYTIPLSQAAVQARRNIETRHLQIKDEAHQLWPLLEHPVYESPMNPENHFPAEAATLAKRRRRWALETVLLGISRTRKAVRDFERIARRNGNDREQVERLRGYPNALTGYKRILRKLRARR